MKKLSKFLSLFIGLLTIGLTTGVAYGATSFNNVKETSAATENKDCIAFTLEDQVGGTSDGRNPILHFWDITVDSSMGYASSPGADLTAAGFVNDLENGATSGSAAFDGTNADSGFTWASESGGKRYWTIRLPWYVTGCQFTIKHGDYWSHTNLTVNGSGSYMIYMFNYWSYTELSIGAKGSSGESHVQAAEKYAISATASPSTGGTATVKGNGGSAVASGNYFKRQKITANATANSGYAFSSWSDSGTAEHTFYASKDVALTANFTANTYTVNKGTQTNGTLTVNSTGTYNSDLSISWSPEGTTGYTYTNPVVKVYSGTSASGTLLATYSSGISANFNMSSKSAYYDNVYITLSYTKTGNPYTVTLDPNGGSVSKTSLDVTFGSPYGTIPTPTRTDSDYSFNCWKDENGNTITSSSTVSIAKNHTLTADWTYSPSSRTVTLAANPVGYGIFTKDSVSVGSVNVPNNTAYTTNGNTLTFATTPAATVVTATPAASTDQYSYRFTGWSSSSGTITESTTITAYFARDENSYDITVGVNDSSMGSASMNATNPITYGTSVTLTATPNEHYRFVKWSDNDTNATRNITVTGDATYTANFAGNVYTATFSAPDATTHSKTTQSVTYPNNTITFPTTNECKRTGYTLLGWSDGVTTYDPGNTLDITSDKTFTAVWKINQYTITWDTDGGNITSEPGTYTTTADYGTPIVAPTVEKDGYTFTGWSPALPEGATVTQNQTYTAQWQRADGYYVHVYGTNERYIKMSGTGEVSAIANLADGETFKVTHVVNGVETSWHGFTELKYDSGADACDARTKAQVIDDDTKDHNMKANLPNSNPFKIYYKPAGDGVTDPGVYIPSVVHVEFDLNGKTGTAPASQIKYSRGLVDEPEDPTTTESYEFEGWYSDAACTDKWNFSTYQLIYFSTDDEHVATQKIYANWISTASVDITLNKNGGTGGPDKIEDVKVGDTISIDECPTKLNNTFTGYFTPGGTKVINNDGTNAAPYEESFGTTLNAGWTINPGVYLWVKGDTSQDGARKMTLNKGTQYVWNNITLAANDEIRCYYENGNYGNVNSITWSHPNYQGVKEGDNCKVLTAGTYDIYYDTKSGEMHLAVPSMPSNGYYFVVNGDTSKDAMHKAEEWSGYTGTEYKASFTVKAGDKIRVYFQDSTVENTKVYDATLAESIKEWSYVKGEGLICPENSGGYYSFYLIKNSETGGYDLISIFQEGEIDAVEYAKAFNTKFKVVCNDQGHTDKTSLKNAWLEMKDSFDTLLAEHPTAANLLKVVDYDYANEDLREFAKKYDYIYSKYENDLKTETLQNPDFVGRFANGGSGQRMASSLHHSYALGENEDQTVLIVVIAASATLLATTSALLLLLKKKKKAK